MEPIKATNQKSFIQQSLFATHSVKNFPQNVKYFAHFPDFVWKGMAFFV